MGKFVCGECGQAVGKGPVGCAVCDRDRRVKAKNPTPMFEIKVVVPWCPDEEPRRLGFVLAQHSPDKHGVFHEGARKLLVPEALAIKRKLPLSWRPAFERCKGPMWFEGERTGEYLLAYAPGSKRHTPYMAKLLLIPDWD